MLSKLRKQFLQKKVKEIVSYLESIQNDFEYLLTDHPNHRVSQLKHELSSILDSTVSFSIGVDLTSPVDFMDR